VSTSGVIFPKSDRDEISLVEDNDSLNEYVENNQQQEGMLNIISIKLIN